ncbi:hypothetical protein NC652_028375 [Populus alba x Populus x berolinensis]|nr:hypothetical protein NC652_028375 [Populus alba x Populus x berolinensis]
MGQLHFHGPEGFSVKRQCQSAGWKDYFFILITVYKEDSSNYGDDDASEVLSPAKVEIILTCLESVVKKG